MDTWLIVVLIIVVIAALVVIGLAVSRRQASAKKEEQAREHLNEARERQARAESARAAADEKAAALRRERAELDQRAAQQEREAATLAADADREQAKAAELTARAQKLAPHLAQNDTAGRVGDDNPDHAGYADLSGYQAGNAAGAGSDTHQGVDDGTRLDLPAGDPGVRDATSYRHTAPVTDPEGGTDRDGDGRPDGGLGERLDGDDQGRQTYVDRETVVDSDGDGRADSVVRETSVDRDGDGVPDDREGGPHRLKDRLSGDRADDTDGDRPDTDRRPSLKERLTGRPDNR